MDDDMRVLNDLFMIQESSVQSSKDGLLEGGGLLDVITAPFRRIRETYNSAREAQNTAGCSIVELLALAAIMALFSFLYIGYFSQLAKQDMNTTTECPSYVSAQCTTITDGNPELQTKCLSTLCASLTRPRQDQIMKKIFATVPKFVELVYGRVLSYFGQTKTSKVLSQTSSAILQGLPKPVIALINQVTEFNFREYFGSEKIQLLVQGDPATTALEFSSFQYFWNTLTSARSNVLWYCFLIKLLFLQPVKVVQKVFLQGLGKRNASNLPPAVVQDVDKLREKMD